MSIEMSSGCGDVEPEGLVSSVVQSMEGLLGIHNLNSGGSTAKSALTRPDEKSESNFHLTY